MTRKERRAIIDLMPSIYNPATVRIGKASGDVTALGDGEGKSAEVRYFVGYVFDLLKQAKAEAEAESDRVRV